jgi:hypothetical protein
MAGDAPPRSPRYPQMNLQQAIEKLAMLYNADKTAGAPADAAVIHMGFKGRSGPANTALAALRRFGLVESKNGRIAPSQRGIAILVLPESDPRRAFSLREAALLPQTYKVLFDRYSETGLPSDQTLESELLLGGEFNHNVVYSFVKDFRASLRFAGLIDDKGVILYRMGTPSTTDDPDVDEDGGTNMQLTADSTEITLPDDLPLPRSQQAGTQRLSAQSAPTSTIFMSDLQGPVVRFDLPRGNLVEIRLRSKLTPAEFQKLKKIFELSELAFVEDPDELDHSNLAR